LNELPKASEVATAIRTSRVTTLIIIVGLCK